MELAEARVEMQRTWDQYEAARERFRRLYNDSCMPVTIRNLGRETVRLLDEAESRAVDWHYGWN